MREGHGLIIANRDATRAGPLIQLCASVDGRTAKLVRRRSGRMSVFLVPLPIERAKSEVTVHARVVIVIAGPAAAAFDGLLEESVSGKLLSSSAMFRRRRIASFSLSKCGQPAVVAPLPRLTCVSIRRRPLLHGQSRRSLNPFCAAGLALHEGAVI